MLIHYPSLKCETLKGLGLDFNDLDLTQHPFGGTSTSIEP